MKNYFRIFVFGAFLFVVIVMMASCPLEGLPATTSLTAVTVSATSIRLTWVPVAGASTYNVYRTTDSTWQNYGVISTSVTNTVYTDNNLYSGTTYYYKVGAKRDSSSSATVGELSEAASATTAESATTPTTPTTPDSGGSTSNLLSAPQNLDAVSMSTSQIRLSWTPVDDAAYYNVYRTTDSTWESYSIVSTSTTTTIYTDSSLSANTTYYYKVGAKRTSTTGPVGELSEAASATTAGQATTPESGLLTAPQNLDAVSTSTSQIRLSWTPVDDATYYIIYRTTDVTWESYSIVSTATTNTIYNDTSLSPNTTYYYKVGARRTYTTDPVGELSEAASATTMPTGSTSVSLAAPENLTATVHGRIITLEWDAVEGASTYEIYGSFSSGGTFVLIGSYSRTAVNIVSMAQPVLLEPSTTYYFKVSASNGELSEEISATTGT